MGMVKIVLAAVITNNYVLAKFLGICPFLGVSKKLDNAMGMSIAVIIVMVLATAVTWPIQMLLLVPRGIGYMQTLVFILVIAALVQLIEIVLKKYIPSLHKALGIYLPLITTNCAVLGVAINNVNYEYDILTSVINGLATSIGFAISIVILAGIREKMEYNNIPKYLKGMPIVLITAGLMAIAFCGFSGLI